MYVLNEAAKFGLAALSLQSGTYVCTAYNDLGSLQAGLRLRVDFPPTCRLRKHVEKLGSKNRGGDRGGGADNRLVLRCDVTDASPNNNFSFAWFHNGKPMGNNNKVITQLGGATEQ